MNFEMTIGTEQGEIIPIGKRFIEKVFITAFSALINVMDMKTTHTFEISAETTRSAQSLNQSQTSCFSRLHIANFIRWRSYFLAAAFSICKFVCNSSRRISIFAVSTLRSFFVLITLAITIECDFFSFFSAWGAPILAWHRGRKIGITFQAFSWRRLHVENIPNIYPCVEAGTWVSEGNL